VGARVLGIAPDPNTLVVTAMLFASRARS